MKKLINLAFASAAAVTATLIGLPASPASAAPSVSSLVEVSDNFPVVAGTEIRGTLNCPSGYRLVGAGGSAGGATTVFTALTPTFDNTGATMVGKLIELAPDPNQNRVHLEITCAPADQFADVITVETHDHRASPGVFSQGISQCPAGYFAFGGGGYFSAGTRDVQGAASSNSTNSPSADGTAWTYAGVAPPGVRRALVTVTQCAPRTGRDFLVQFGNTSTDGNRETSNFVDCPSGYTAIAGGFYASRPDGSLATPASAEDSSGLGGRWFVRGFTPTNTKLVALAQCLR